MSDFFDRFYREHPDIPRRIIIGITTAGCDRPVCPCCAAHLQPDEHGDDGAFCWDCGLYAQDKPEQCDNPGHARE